MKTSSLHFQKRLQAAASIAVGIIPIFVLEHWFGVSTKLMVGYGIGAWIIGTAAIKMPLYHFFVVRVLHNRLSNLQLAACQGLVSALAELGAAAAFFIFLLPKLSLAQVIGFGAGAGAVEAIILPFIGNPLQGTPVGEHAGELIERAQSRPTVQWLDVPERILASLIHISTRGLVYLAIATASFLPALLALGIFAAVDAGAYYGHLEKWRYDELRVLARFHLYLAALAVPGAFLFIMFWYMSV